MNVSLTVQEREFCRVAGDLRTEANKNKYNIGDYDPSRFNLTSRQSNRLGVFAEAVAFKYLGGNVLEHTLEEWAHYVPNDHPNYTELVKNQADLFGSVEVRRANAPHSPIPLRTKDRDHAQTIIQVYVPYKQPLRTKAVPHPAIMVPLHGTILGFAYVTDEGTTPEWASNKGTIVVPRRPMSEFKGLV